MRIGGSLGRLGRDINNTVNSAGRDINNAVNRVGNDLNAAVNRAGEYETNKFDLKSKVEEGNWIVAWSDDISETDVASGIVAGGISIYSANPAPFLAWIQDLVNRTISSLTEDARDKFPDAIKEQVNQLASEVIKQAIQGKDTREVFEQFDTVDFKAGAIKYSGRNMAFGATVSTTWGMKPYIAFRWRQ